MTLSSAFKSYVTLIVHPSISGIIFVVNPLPMQSLEELHTVLHVVYILLQNLQMPCGTSLFLGVLASDFEE
jgi:hypothetical protein